ncbi:hypothetical protein [Actinospica robiniae]|uniref:hypothetical protein n=1 Tax=Actinospica robiniae TaxID=304901 RepID=UPI000422E962|nr:hypothetical protein [Actinospica robiniae]
MRAGQLERITQGTHIGYRHPDAAWTSLPSRIEAAPAALEFARWYAGRLGSLDPAEREAAGLTALTIAAAAAAAGDGALAAHIRGHLRRPGRRSRTALTAASALARG